jgi:acyl-ACP thioesterase
MRSSTDLETPPGWLERLVPIPPRGRVFVSRRRLGLSDLDPQGRLRLDSVARHLQDAAIDDVRETGWGAPDHLWVVRRIRLDVERPFLDDSEVEVATWCSGVAAIAAGRRWSLAGDRGGRIEVDSVWIHLGPDGRPARLEDFDVYAEAAGDRRVSTHVELPEAPGDAARAPWPLRATDVDLHGHLNNASYWQAIEHRLLGREPGLRSPLRARLHYGAPIDLGDRVELAEWSEGACYSAAFVVGGRVRAAASVEAVR